MGVNIKTTQEIAIMREAGKKLASIMEEIGKEVVVGKKTSDLDKLAEKLVFDSGGRPAFKGYGDRSNPFPATICASTNNEVVHGIPGEEKILKDGELLKIDIGMEYQGLFVDMARSFAVGKISHEKQNLMAAAEQAFWQGIAHLKEGSLLSDYSKAAESYVKETGFSVVRSLVGHGIGKALHEDPQIPNYFDPNMPDFELKDGMTFALEPMINEGTFQTQVGKDGWVYETADGKLSAHYENTVLITKEGVEVLTILN